MKKVLPPDRTAEPVKGDLLLYQTDEQGLRLEVRLQDESVWLTINQMAELFQVDKSGISRHLKNVFETRELERGATVAKFATVQREGGREVIRQVEYFNLDAIISVGYRINSLRGTRFRIWATQRLKEYIIKGRRKNSVHAGTQTRKTGRLASRPCVLPADALQGRRKNSVHAGTQQEKRDAWRPVFLVCGCSGDPHPVPSRINR
jgi:hypothetical protein